MHAEALVRTIVSAHRRLCMIECMTDELSEGLRRMNASAKKCEKAQAGMGALPGFKLGSDVDVCMLLVLSMLITVCYIVLLA